MKVRVLKGAIVSNGREYLPNETVELKAEEASYLKKLNLVEEVKSEPKRVNSKRSKKDNDQ